MVVIQESSSSTYEATDSLNVLNNLIQTQASAQHLYLLYGPPNRLSVPRHIYPIVMMRRGRLMASSVTPKAP